ncbi:MAG: hypothetical protein NNA30_11855, partial [Nitrospira sp.]|nr:hypothetical protein [Nitrospira sp.]
MTEGFDVGRSLRVPASREAAVVDGGPDQSGLLIVIGQEFRLRLNALGELVLQRACKTGMQASTRFSGQRMIGGVLQQRVFELKLGVRDV